MNYRDRNISVAKGNIRCKASLPITKKKSPLTGKRYEC